MDDLDYGGCNYTHMYDYYNWNNNETFSGVADYIYPVIHDPVCQAFGKDPANMINITFNDFYELCDVLVAESF